MSAAYEKVNLPPVFSSHDHFEAVEIIDHGNDGKICGRFGLKPTAIAILVLSTLQYIALFSVQFLVENDALEHLEKLLQVSFLLFIPLALLGVIGVRKGQPFFLLPAAILHSVCSVVFVGGACFLIHNYFNPLSTPRKEEISMALHTFLIFILIVVVVLNVFGSLVLTLAMFHMLRAARARAAVG